MQRPESPGAEALLGHYIPVLNAGHICLIDYMGNDAEIVRAARVSYGEQGKKLRSDRGLLRYLMRHDHTSPFEMCEIKLLCKMPIFVARQWIRHRTASVNEVSLRYTGAEGEFYVPSLDMIGRQSKSNKQGREGPQSLCEEDRLDAFTTIFGANNEALNAYNKLADRLGVARELARTVLPANLYTSWVWKIDLHNLFHFLRLRLHPHAQAEIREYAKAIQGIVEAWVPVSWDAFRDYRLASSSFSRQELEVLRAMALRSPPERPQDGLSDREWGELLDKLRADPEAI